MGGRAGRGLDYTGGFACKKKGADGLTGQQRARLAGAKGGKLSKRGPAKPKTEKETVKVEVETKIKETPKKGFFTKMFGGID